MRDAISNDAKRGISERTSRIHHSNDFTRSDIRCVGIHLQDPPEYLESCSGADWAAILKRRPGRRAQRDVCSPPLNNFTWASHPFTLFSFFHSLHHKPTVQLLRNHRPPQPLRTPPTNGIAPVCVSQTPQPQPWPLRSGVRHVLGHCALSPDALAHPSVRFETDDWLVDDEDEESTPPSSPPAAPAAPIARRGKFDDEEEDSDVCQPMPRPCLTIDT
jgi:hypothetical protein